MISALDLQCSKRPALGGSTIAGRFYLSTAAEQITSKPEERCRVSS